MVIGVAVGNVGKAQQRTSDVRRVPAPVKGIDARVSATAGDPLQCIYTFNLQPYEEGMKVRNGYREWQTNIVSLSGVGVHTIIPYDATGPATSDRLFAVTNEGIWDVTTAGGIPALKVGFVDTSANAGHGVYTQYVTDAEENIIFYADSLNGLFQYDPVGDTWAPAAGITGPVVENINFVVIHKQRLWLIEENSTKAWYLPVGSVAGVATEFFFGSKFRHGGVLQGLFNFSVDGGSGVDDYLVAVSSAGDVLPYQGSDPAAPTTWELRGTYFIGAVPRGGNFATRHGGELYFISVFGLLSLNDMLQGVDQSTQASMRSTSISIAALIRDRVIATLDSFGWQIRVIPSEGGLLISSPQINSGPYLQYYFNFATTGWAFWRGMNMLSFDSWKGSVAWGDGNNRVLYMDVTVDDQLLNPDPGDINGQPIDFSVLTSFQHYESPGLHKRVKIIRPDFLADNEPTFSVTAKYDYDVNEFVPTVLTPSPVEDAGWDVGIWDIANWGGLNPQNYNTVLGSWGYGRYVAIAMVGQSRDRCRFVGWDVIHDTGGPLI